MKINQSDKSNFKNYLINGLKDVFKNNGSYLEFFISGDVIKLALHPVGNCSDETWILLDDIMKEG